MNQYIIMECQPRVFFVAQMLQIFATSGLDLEVHGDLQGSIRFVVSQRRRWKRVALETCQCYLVAHGSL